MIELSSIQQICLWILPMVFAITMHEAAHAWVAARCGDNTAKAMGRLSLNPIKHIDLFGTLIIPIVILVISHFNFAFGWAKPVPINPRYFRKPIQVVYVAFAGPLANLMMAILWCGVLKLSLYGHPNSSMPALFFLLSAKSGIIINLVLGFLNLIPIPPLDGGRIAIALLPYRGSMLLQKLEPYGFFILLGLMFSGALAMLLNPVINTSLRLLQSLFHL